VTPADVEGVIFDIDTFAVHDGPGIRMAVYLKGCPLSCLWCHSPESQSPRPELIYLRDRCTFCAKCAQVCRHEVHQVSASGHELARSSCVVCGQCADACPSSAVSVVGRRMHARALVARAVRLKPFFTHSAGGVTLTGGEVSLQPEFAGAILAGCREAGIHTAIETCGACRWPTLAKLAELSDLIFYDLKMMDEDRHRQLTGAGNAQIMDNITRLDPSKVIVRVPLIPGITDAEPDLRDIFAFVRSHDLKRLDLLPFNTSTQAKYEWLGRECQIAGDAQTAAEMEAAGALAREMGLETSALRQGARSRTPAP
jgi:pyruvate formate lyase activating enzyme